MTPQNIATRLADLKNKAKTHASNARIYNVYERRDASDELKTEMQDLNNQLTEMYIRLDDILADKHKTPFSTNQWFEALLDKRHYTEPNPRLVYEEEQILLQLEKEEEDLKIKLQKEEEQKKLQLQKEKEQRRLQLLKEEEQRKLRLQKEEEQHRLQLIEEQQRKLQLQKEEEERNLHLQRIEDYKEICKNGPDSFGKINELINNGFDIQKDGRIYDISTLFRMGRSIQFIDLLIRVGMKTNENDLKELEKQRAIYDERIKKEQEEAERKKQAELERKQKELFQRQEKERIEQFKKLCNEYSNHLPDNSQNESVRSLKKLIEQGLDIRKINNFDIIECCVNNGKSKRFLQIVVEAGAFVKAKHLKQFYDEYDKLQEKLTAKQLFVSPSSFNHINWKIEILENAKNLEDKAILLISKRKRLDKIKGIIVLSVFILAIIIIVLYNIT